MSKELHLYTGGDDPFVVPLGEVTLFIHQGEAPAKAPQSPGATLGIYKQTQLSPLYENYIVAPDNPDDLLRILDAQGNKVELGVALRSADEGHLSTLGALFEGLSHSRLASVKIHAVQQRSTERKQK